MNLNNKLKLVFENLKVFCLIFILFSVKIQAQADICDCKEDLDYIVAKLKETPSFKRQMTQEKLIVFERSYTNFSEQLNSPISTVKCFTLLKQLINLIDDFHYNLYFNKSYDTSYLGSRSYSDEMLAVLRQKLSAKPIESLEGIYFLGKDSLEIGILALNNSSFEGVVLSDNSAVWRKGEVYLEAQKNHFEKYNLLIHKPMEKRLQMLNNITYDNGRLISLKKAGSLYNREFKTDKSSNWEFKVLSNDVHYIYMGNFSRQTQNRNQAETLLTELKSKDLAPHIIIDLRSNSGGASKVSNPFFKFLKKTKSKLYVITNSFTISNAEQFTVKLKGLENVVHLGQTTFGALAYGSNYGNLYDTPSGYFSFYPTDMDFHKAYFQYEGFGIVPDIPLSFEKDWIEQTLEFIKKGN